MQSTIKIIRKNIKNINLRINTNLEIILSVPFRLTDSQIQEIIFSKIDWIRKHQLKMQFVKHINNDNENFQYLGQIYTINASSTIF